MAFVLGGSLEVPALVPMNYTAKVLAGDEYSVPVEIPVEPSAAEYIESTLDHRGWARMSPADGTIAVRAMLSISDFSDRPLIVANEEAEVLARLSPVHRACITLLQIQDAAREVMPERDPAQTVPDMTGRPIDQARALGFAIYWAIGDGLTATRRVKAMIAAGWPDSVIALITQPPAEPATA
jgi:hypothetical protein